MRENLLNIKLENISKRFLSEWIFKNISLEISRGEKISILGSNGSGKSTFLQCVSTFQEVTSGKIEYRFEEKLLKQSDHYKYLSFASPYMELIEDFSFREAVIHQQKFKSFYPELSTEDICEISGLGKNNTEKQLKLFSSGMKQRAKITLAVLSNVPLLLLDEPCSNLDSNGINWYGNLIREFASHKTILVCSNNIQAEFEFCNRHLNIQDFKK